MSFTAAAISTPPGEGGIAVIRISGPEAISVADKIFDAKSGKRLISAAGYTAQFGSVHDAEGNLIDEAIALIFRAPKSYTGEDIAELSVHGGRIAASLTLRAAIAAGAVPAGPGEFTKRAFLNGKLNLAEAESVMGLISARSAEDLRFQLSVKNGATFASVQEIRTLLTRSAGDIAAFSDFPDEEIPGLSEKGIRNMLAESAKRIESLIQSFDAGRVLHDGIRTAIAGAPNVGKSTLMNLLGKTERSIVTDIPGTTRDIIEQTVLCGSVPLLLSDTAGLRETDDQVEAAGIRRAEACIDNAQLVLAVFDGSKPLTETDRALLDRLRQKPAIAVINKTDLGSVLTSADFPGMRSVFLSARTGEGSEALQNAIAEITGVAHLEPGAAALSTERQHGCAVRALSALNEAVSALDAGFAMDAAGVCVDDALSAILELTGERVSDEVANDVFRRFCIGK